MKVNRLFVHVFQVLRFIKIRYIVVLTTVIIIVQITAHIINFAVTKDSTHGTIMTTIDRESIRHSIFMPMIPSVCLSIFDFQMASSNNAGASFNSA